MRCLQKLQISGDTIYSDLDSPVGCLTIITSNQGLLSILWDNDLCHEANQKTLSRIQRSTNSKIIKQTKKQLQEYFNGERKKFDLPIVFNGTFFQIKAWEQLCKIGYGQTISYGAQAKQLGNKNKARAVGLANGANPISIVVPCHRVIGSNGQMTGFGGGIDKKAYLLEFEQRVINNETY